MRSPGLLSSTISECKLTLFCTLSKQLEGLERINFGAPWTREHWRAVGLLPGSSLLSICIQGDPACVGKALTVYHYNQRTNHEAKHVAEAFTKLICRHLGNLLTSKISVEEMPLGHSEEPWRLLNSVVEKKVASEKTRLKKIIQTMEFCHRRFLGKPKWKNYDNSFKIKSLWTFTPNVSVFCNIKIVKFCLLQGALLRNAFNILFLLKISFRVWNV